MHDWAEMNCASRKAFESLTKADIPSDPGVYAIYRDGTAMYVGEAKDLAQRIWSNHSGRGVVLTGSAFRRNVAEHLGIATARAIKKREYLPSEEDATRIRSWIDGCDIAWLVCNSEADAIALEDALKREFMPPLTVR